MADDRRRGVGCNTDSGGTRKHAADLVGGQLDLARYIQMRDRTVKRATIPEIILGTSQATVPGFHRPGQPAVPLHARTGIIGGRSLAAHLVQTIALARTFVIEALNELARIEMQPAIALVMQALTVEQLWPPDYGKLLLFSPSRCK